MRTWCAVIKYMFESPSSASVLPVTEEQCFQPCTYYFYPVSNFIMRGGSRQPQRSVSRLLWEVYFGVFKAFYIFQGDMHHTVRAECTPALKKNLLYEKAVY